MSRSPSRPRRLRPLPRRLAAALLAVTAGALPVAQAALQGADAPRAPGQFVWIGQHRLHVYCQGQGSPTVIFESGLGGTSLDWSLVQPDIARHTRACVYDRAGYGWSDRGPAPRSSRRIVAELESLLGYSSIAGPYVLVGHSFGGLNVQLFAKRNPERVAGMVLVDSSHERQFSAFEQAGIHAIAPRGGTFMLRNYNNVPSNMPPSVKPTAQRFAYAADTVLSIHSELANMRLSARQVGNDPLPDVPMAVVIHDPEPYLRSPSSSRMANLWWEMQSELASRTSHSRLVVAATPDHYVQFADPETVTRAILDVLEEARGAPNAAVSASVDGCRLEQPVSC
jgi:pimeloyl-ACP methyl ester carboxylesterase